MRKLRILKSVVLGTGLSLIISTGLYAQAPADTTGQQPKVEGSQFQMPDPPQPKVTRRELMRQVALDVLQVLLTPRDRTPKQRLRGDDVDLCHIAGYSGPCKFYQFTNSDFSSKDNSCAQAALATALWAVDKQANFSNTAAVAKSVWATTPPKITLGNMIQVQGSLGTDWRQLNTGLDTYKKFGIKYAWIDGTLEIRKYLKMGLPVIIMLDAGTLPQFQYKWWTGHWVTAFGYDSNFIYVSNFPGNKMTWGQLEDAFKKGTLAVGHGTAGRACVVYK